MLQNYTPSSLCWTIVSFFVSYFADLCQRLSYVVFCLCVSVFVWACVFDKYPAFVFSPVRDGTLGQCETPKIPVIQTVSARWM